MRLLGHPVKFSRTPADPTRPAPALGEHTEEVLAESGLSAELIAALLESGAAGGLNAAGRAGAVPLVNTNPATSSASPPGVPGSAEGRALLKISELAERAEVPVATVRHYLREGLLPEPVKTSKQHGVLPARVR